VPAAVPYADLGNPQTLNLYVYVKNNPLNLTDPAGHSFRGRVSSSEGMYVVPAKQWVGPESDPLGDIPFSSVNSEAQEQQESPDVAALISQVADVHLDPSQMRNCICEQGQENEQRPYPPVPVPGAPDSGWKWSPDAQNPRGGTWKPTNWPGPGSPPSASLEPGKGGKPRHWDVDDGTGKRRRYNDGGKLITPGEAHASSSIASRAKNFVHAHPVATGIVAGVVITGAVAVILFTGGSAALPLAAAAAAF